MRPRNTGKTTRAVAGMLRNMFGDSTNTHYIYICTEGKRGACHHAEQLVRDVMKAYGIETVGGNGCLQYSVKWDGKVLFPRRIVFYTVEEWRKHAEELSMSHKDKQVLYWD